MNQQPVRSSTAAVVLDLGRATNGYPGTSAWIADIQKVSTQAFGISGSTNSTSAPNEQKQPWAECDLEYVAVLGEK